MNAILGVVLLDENNSYDWYYTYNPGCNSTTHHTDRLFEMLRANMFNRKKGGTRECNGTTIHEGAFSFITIIEWSSFINSTNSFIEQAIEIMDRATEYDLKIQLS